LQINDLQKQLQIKQIQITDLLNREIELQDNFQMATSDSRFSDFFRKIYKKKYKPPKFRSAGNGKGLKPAVTAKIFYTSAQGCYQGFFLEGKGGKIFVCKCTF
jgi:hypothetical protein